MTLLELIVSRGFRYPSQVADLANVSGANLCRYVRGSVSHRPFPWFAERVARVLRVSRGHVYGALDESRRRWLLEEAARARVREGKISAAIEEERGQR